MKKIFLVASIVFVLNAPLSAASEVNPNKNVTTPEAILDATQLCVAELDANGIDSKVLMAEGWIGAPWENPRVPDAKGLYVFTKGKVMMSTVAPAAMQPTTCIVAGHVQPGQEKLVSAELSKRYPAAKQLKIANGWKQAIQLDDFRLLILANNRIQPKPDDIEDGGIMLTAFYVEGQMRDIFLSEMKDLPL